VLVGGREAEAVERVCARMEDAAPFIADLREESLVRAAANAVGEIDVLVHCAGIVPSVSVPTREAWREVFEVNVVAVVDLTERLLPALRARGGLQSS
jgi:NAD(P)-dependent dehydrogenase (short-subunit alcohol dehydrogenase family)